MDDELRTGFDIEMVVRVQKERRIVVYTNVAKNIIQDAAAVRNEENEKGKSCGCVGHVSVCNCCSFRKSFSDRSAYISYLLAGFPTLFLFSGALYVHKWGIFSMDCVGGSALQAAGNIFVGF